MSMFMSAVIIEQEMNVHVNDTRFVCLQFGNKDMCKISIPEYRVNELVSLLMPYCKPDNTIEKIRLERYANPVDDDVLKNAIAQSVVGSL